MMKNKLTIGPFYQKQQYKAPKNVKRHYINISDADSSLVKVGRHFKKAVSVYQSDN